MRHQELSEMPKPTLDPPPDPGPGGPADRVEHDVDDVPLATPDQPRAAQVEEESVPDEIEQAEELDEEEKDLPPEHDEPA